MQPKPVFASPVLRLASTSALAAAALVAGCQVQLPAPPARQPAPSAAAVPTPPAVEQVQQAAALPGFSDQLVFGGRTGPIAVRFASNGRVFIAEESGLIYFYDSLTDGSPTLFADLRGQVNSYWDRGLLGFTLDPNYATNGHVYVLYSHDTATNPENNQSIANRNGTDNCPSTPGGTSEGCVTYGRLSRITDTFGSYPITARLDLITEWPQQFPSHSIGALNFGPDGRLYAAGGDGASFNSSADYGNWGIPKNPLGDPPGGFGVSLTLPTAQGGSSRSQSFRRPSNGNVTLNGSIIRVDPTTGLGVTGNPQFSHADADAKRLIAFGLRNPYRFTFHPTTGDIWIGDVGAGTWEEINRIPAPVTGSPMKNFGWPCYEGSGRFPLWDNLNINICETLYSTNPSQHTPPYYAYRHDQAVYTGDQCGTGSSAISGLAFYPPSGGNYPSQYRNALFFADITRDCIFVMRPGTNGLPDPSTRTNFVVAALNPVDLQIGPNNDLFYVDYGASGTGSGNPTAGNGGLRRIRYAAPTAIASANPTEGPAPLAVQFTGSASTPGLTGDTLSYAWDLDGDTQYDDSTAVNPTRTYTVTGNVTVRLRVTDQRGGSHESEPITIAVGAINQPPVPVIDSPTTALRWVVNQDVQVSGHATDPEDGPIPPERLFWQLTLQHCPSGCHPHDGAPMQPGATSSFPAPNHDYPTHLILQLTAVDSQGRAASTSVRLDPQTVDITMLASPALTPGLDLQFGEGMFTTPFTRAAIVGASISIAAPAQVRGSTQYSFQSWSDGGPDSDDEARIITVGSSPATYTASFTAGPAPWQSQDIGAVAAAGSWTLNGGTHTVVGNGADIWNAADEFRFVYREITGDGTITARLVSFTGTGTINANAKAGVMIRESLNANSPHLLSCLPVGGQATLIKQIRRTTAGASSAATTGASPSFPRWVRVTRAGNSLSTFESTNGTSWTQVGAPQTINTLGATAYFGMAVTSHVDGTNYTATFDNVTITTPAPPTAPTGLSAMGGINQAVLTWTDTSNNETGFKIERKLATDPDTSFAQVGTAAANATTFTNTSVAAGNYTYRVRAAGSPTDSGYSNTANATVSNPPPPGAPSGLIANDGVNQSILTWTDNASNETGFRIERKPQGDPDTSFAQVGTTSANVATFTNSSIPAGTYTYRVFATNGSGDSPPSNSDDAVITNPQPPAAPSDLTANGGSAQAVLAWTDNANNETGFKIERKPLGDPDTSFMQVGTAAANATGFTNTSVPAGSYTYRVRATNAVGDSEYSNTADATVTAPPPWQSQDIGAVAAAGSWTLDGGTHTVAGNGADIWNAADEFRYVYQQVTGDVTITARVSSFTNAGNANGKAGVMIRESLAASSPHALACLPPQGTTTLVKQIKRLTAGATSTADNGPSPSFPAWVRVTRTGNTLRAYHSTDGTTFTQLGTDTVINTLGSTAYVGLAVTSHVDGANATAVFDSVSLNTPPPPTPPAAPTGLSASGGAGQATLAWTDNADNETGFEIERKPQGDPDSSFAQVGTAAANATGFTNTSVPAGSYTYRVRASNAVGDSAYSNTADATVTVSAAPAAPTNLAATTANGNSATLTWTDNSSNETGFRVERKVGAGSFTTLATKAANVVTHTDGSLTPNTYTYRVIATGTQDSAPSNEVVVVVNNPVADSYVREGTNAGNNYGTETFVKIKLNTTVNNNRRGYVRFSLAGVAANVTSAKLRLYGQATTNTKQVGAHAVSNITWGETTITFSNAPAMTTPAIQTRPITTTAAYVEWDVTSYIQQQRTANATAVSLGLLTTSNFPDTETNINSRENTANKPILIITSRP